MGYVISNVRMAKSMYPHGFKMNGCRAMGVICADVIDTDAHAVIYSGTIEMCKGKIEIMGA